MKARLAITLVLLAAVLLMIVPVSAQGTARVRFVNLRAGSNGLNFTDQEGNTLAELGPFGSAADFMDVDATVTGLGFSVLKPNGFSSTATMGMDPIFTAGHDYLAMMIGDDEEDASLIIDLTNEFGGADAVVDDGMGRLLIIYYVRDLTSGAFTFWTADGTLMGTYFLSLDTSSFQPKARTLSVAVAPGDYSLSATAANDPTAALMPQQTLSLAADEITIVGISGGYPDTVQAVLIGPNGVTTLDQ